MNSSTFSVGGCRGQSMLLFQKMVVVPKKSLLLFFFYLYFDFLKIRVCYLLLSYIIQCYSAERQQDTEVFSCSGCLHSLKVVWCRSVQNSCWHYMPRGVSNTLDYMRVALLYYIGNRPRYIRDLNLIKTFMGFYY